ncbi:hypothetical protein FHS85_004964 [Rhodoligotrophos appendicifer]|uniref:hypothetical protein n=1 Tax=Rhodoligotrophos appendicifer TaxID=987056 RepID=UPI0011867360|nr:hypothetical protein [Rhodoligotrophos appendicifer]
MVAFAKKVQKIFKKSVKYSGEMPRSSIRFALALSLILQTFGIFAEASEQQLTEAATLGVPIHDINKRFNALARRAKSELRMLPGDCEGAEPHTCKFQLEEYLVGSSWAASPESNALRYFMIFADQTSAHDNAVNAANAFGLLIAIFSPELTANQRGELMSALVEGTMDSGKHEERQGGVAYSLTRTSGLGLWFTVEPAASKSE